MRKDISFGMRIVRKVINCGYFLFKKKGDLK